MSFRSRKEANYCYWVQSEARKKGEEPAWDCDAWASRTDFSKIPYSKNHNDKPVNYKRPVGRPPKIHIGPRGGRYYMKNGKKIYVIDRKNRAYRMSSAKK